MRRIKNTIACFLLFIATPALPEVIPIEPPTRGFFGSQPTMTMPYQRSDAELTIVVIMGHPGRFGLKVGDFSVKNTTAQMMRDFVYRTRVKANVVILDSPHLLQTIGDRSTSDHLIRIESVVKFYSDKFQLPVWLLGHSMGSISVSEYLNRSSENRSSLAGAILSAGMNETRITEDWNTPALVIHHEKDGCEGTTFSSAKRYFGRIKERNSKVTELATVRGGFSLGGPPCSTGYHMYQGAYEEVFKLVEDFIERQKQK